MRPLNDAERTALQHLHRFGPARRLPGGVWTSGDSWSPGDYQIPYKALEALLHRGMVWRDLESNTYEITPIGRTRLEILGAEDVE